MGPAAGRHPHWKLIDAHRGYHLFDIRADAVDAQVRVVDTVLRPKATARTLANLRVTDGRPGVRRA